MGVAAPFFLMTLFWGGIGGVAPFFLPKESPNRGLLQMMLVITAICCYTFWLGTFLFQVNPLIGPMVDTNTVRVMKWQWGQS